MPINRGDLQSEQKVLKIGFRFVVLDAIQRYTFLH